MLKLTRQSGLQAAEWLRPGDPDMEEKFDYGVSGIIDKVKVPFSTKDYFLYSPALFQASEQMVMDKKPDIILCDYGLSAVYGMKLTKKYELPWIYCPHNIEFRQYIGKISKDIRRVFLTPWVYAVEKKGVKLCDLLVPISPVDADYFSRWTDKAKMIVVPQCFDENLLNPFYPPPRNNPRIILFVGNYNISTNRDAVYTALNEIVDPVVEKYPEVRFQFVGANPPADLKHSHVEFTGFVDDLAAVIKQSDVFISPIQAGWGMPTKVVEALACGKPTIATPVASRAISSEYQNLKVVEIERFPDAIVNALKEDNPVNDADFQTLSQEYTWAGAIQRLADRIDALI